MLAWEPLVPAQLEKLRCEAVLLAAIILSIQDAIRYSLGNRLQ